MNKQSSNFLSITLIFVLLFSCLLTSTASFARPYPFQIVPAATLPTTIIAGGTANATYTITNNTSEQRNNNFIKYLPPNVTQVPGGGFCDASFDLAPGASCTLKLLISGPVNGSDPDPHHHLFACFPGGLTCAGTNYPLNVSTITLKTLTVTPANASITANQHLQYSALATYSDGSTAVVTPTVTWASSNTAVATILASGFATGVGAGSTTISATLNGIIGATTLTVTNPITSIVIAPVPPNASINVNQQQQYSATAHYADGSTSDITSTVTWTSSDTAVATIATGGLATGLATGTTAISATDTASGVTSNAVPLVVNNPLLSIAITPTNTAIATGGTQQYTAMGTYTSSTTPVNITSLVTWQSSNPAVADFVTPTQPGLVTGISVGSVNITATLGAISDTTTLTVNSFLYAVDTNKSVFHCQVNSTGNFTCLEDTSLASYQQIAINPPGTFAYLTNSAGNIVLFCALSSTNGTLSGCTPTGNGFAFSTPNAVTVDPTNTYVYILDANGVNRCEIDTTTPGALKNCVLSMAISHFTSPQGIAINPADTAAYIANSNNSVSHCDIIAAGMLSNCTTLSDVTFDLPTGIAINTAGTYAYIANNGITQTISYCRIKTDGTFYLCLTHGLPFAPLGIAINFADTFAYITMPPSNVYYCPLNSNGSLGICAAGTITLTNANGIAIN